MQENNQHNNPSAKSLLDYHSGKMSDSEKHDLEKEALDDFFLGDALEGYANDPNALMNIEKLRRKIDQRNKERKTGIWFNVRPYYPHMAVAATLFILAFSAYFVLIRTVPNDDDSGFQAKKTNTDSTVLFSDNSQSNKESNASVPKNNSTDQVSKEKSNVELVKPEVIKNINVTDDATDNMNASGVAMQTRPQIHQKDDEKLTQKVAETEDLSRLPAEKKESADAVKANVLTVPESRIAESATADHVENVVVATSKRKMTKSTSPMSVTVIKNESDIAQNFLKNNPFQCFDDKNNPLHGTIIISYKTDKQGQPIKIKVESSSHENCNESAIEHFKKAKGFDKNRTKETIRLDY
jgi:hypothetical protein